jgi:4-hydroxyphenylacetate decarboxylase large subunit
MPKKLSEILEKKGIPFSNEYGVRATDTIVGREIKGEPGPRARKLYDFYLSALSSSTVDFTYWYTRKWDELDGEVTVVRRASALKCAFSHLTPVIYPGELLVMAKERYYRGSFPMPWLTEGYFMSQSSALYQAALKSGGASADAVSKFGSGGGNVTQSVGNVISIAGKFGIRSTEIPALSQLANAWEGRSVDDLAHKYERMVPEYDLKEQLMRSVVCMFDSGYTLPQGRELANYYFPLQYGIGGLIRMAREKKAEVAGNASGDGLVGMDRLYFYEAASLVLEGVQNWIRNYAKEARRLERMEEEPVQKKEYGEIAQCLEWIGENPPRTFREALQLTYTVHLAVINEDCISGYSPGRLGQVLYPYFEQDMEAGRITEAQVLELLECQRIKFTCIDAMASTGVVGGVLSGNTFNNLSVGGLTRDGIPANNRLEMLLFEAAMSCMTTQPTLSVLYDDKLPEDFLMKATECSKTGTGYPAWMNNRVGCEYLISQFSKEGMTVEESRAMAIGGCLETSPGSWHELTLNGKQYMIPGGAGQTAGSGVHFISNPKVLELVLFNGYDHNVKAQVFAPHDKKLDTYEEVWAVFKDYYEQAVAVVNKCANIEHDIWRKHNMAVFNSVLKPDCLAKGRHIGNLGYRYNGTFIVESCGTSNFINSLAALKSVIYEKKKYSLNELKEAILANFGFKTAAEVGSYSLATQEKKDDSDDFDEIHSECLKAPKYGNDDPYADDILKEYEKWFCAMSMRYESLYGYNLTASQISVSSHGPLGAVTLASPDGRLSGTTYGDASMSAYPGTDRNGPYALFNSATVWNHSDSQNSQMNLKIHPSAIQGAEGTRKLLDLTRAYMRKGGFHIQYNIVDSKVLKLAQDKPQDFRDLLVRVAGFTQYWVEIGKPVQDEVIARTEYETVR